MRSAMLLLSAAIAVAEPLQRAHLIVDKAISAPKTKDVIVKDEPFTVTYTLVNLGESDATGVSVKDSFPDTLFTIVSGNSGQEIARIESKANYTAQLVLVPKVSGMMTVSRAEVTYHYAEDGDVMEAKAQSSTIGRVEIVSRQVFDLEVADHTVPLSALFLTALASIVGPYYLFSQAPSR